MSDVEVRAGDGTVLRRVRAARTETIRTRVTAVTKAEVAAIQLAEDRSESDVVRILLEEALAARAARGRR